MWFLVVATLHGSSASTQTDLATCQRNLALVSPDDIQSAYCKSSFSSDIVWFIKDGRRLVEPAALQ